MLSQIPRANQIHAYRLLQCLMVAVRPLSVEELAEVLAFEFDAKGVPCDWRLDNKTQALTQAVLSTCPSLVAIVKGLRYDRQFVQFSHASVKEFLMPTLPGDVYHIHSSSAHTVLVQACLGILLSLDDHWHLDERRGQDIPLAKYAAQHWVKHAQVEGVASRVKVGMKILFDFDRPHFAIWLGIYNMDDPYGWSPMGIPNPLYYAALCGFYDLVQHLAIKHPWHINSICGRYTFPLLAALGEDHIEVAKLLIHYGAEVDAQDKTGKTILLKALSKPRRNLINIVTFLLHYGADVNAQDDSLTTPLHLAEYGGEFEVAEILVKHGADVNSQDNNGKTPLDILLERRTDYEDDVLSHTWVLLEHGAARGGGERPRQR